MTRLQEFSIPTPVKLGVAWAALVLCYLYCDYFALYIPGKLAGMQGGEGPFGAVSQGTLLIAGVWLLVPALMSFLSVCLPATASRILNLVLGAFYCLAMIPLFFASQWYFYKLYLLVEAGVAAAIFWIAIKWPRVCNSTGVSSYRDSAGAQCQAAIDGPEISWSCSGWDPASRHIGSRCVRAVAVGPTLCSAGLTMAERSIARGRSSHPFA